MFRLYTSFVRIGIDIRAIGDFGVGTYIRNVVRTLGKIDRQNDYLLIGEGDRIREMGDLPPNFHKIRFTKPVNTVGGWLGLREILSRHECDLVHIPSLFWMPQVRLCCPYVVTVHDVLDFMYRAKNGANWQRTLHYYSTQQVLRHAGRILAVSNFTKMDIARLFNIRPEKIEVIYNAIDDRFLQGHTSERERQFIAERFQVNYPFLLYAGRIGPQKNLVRIIEAFSALKTELAKEGKYPDLKLIIIGDEVSRHLDVRRTVVKSGVQNDVRFLGFVSIDVLRIFYDTAKIFVFPSLYEGFGLPPLEAMSHGTPVVTSNTSSLPEVVGKAAVMVNPENVFEIMRALHRVLIDQGLRDKLKDSGYEQVKRFSWQNSVRRLLDVYCEVGSAKSAVAAG